VPFSHRRENGAIEPGDGCIPVGRLSSHGQKCRQMRVPARVSPDSHHEVIPAVLLDLGVEFEKAMQNLDVRRGVER
jgi:hypothetical protein